MLLRILTFVAICCWSTFAFASDALVIAVDPDPLVITTSNVELQYELEVANTDIERSAGLMFRLDLPKDRAMLFDFGKTRPVAMWMKNTPLPLDMLFVDETGLVVGVASNTKPQSLDVISSPKPVRFVLEINAGQAAANSIKMGDRLIHPLIKP